MRIARYTRLEASSPAALRKLEPDNFPVAGSIYLVVSLNGFLDDCRPSGSSFLGVGRESKRRCALFLYRKTV